ncbi:hypothetical protein [Romboutsia hominis]|uniref:Uncharacterized protein n=1 Tax=Romboutsia hominis TaxID=1507512 RepID=A0A2P2BQ74_9FIRM|nr:hypothetical protein [Romboutsia hominis]CEI72486.1 Hypothetical protein FRIFI_0946 [Romboutsia hominis]
MDNVIDFKLVVIFMIFIIIVTLIAEWIRIKYALKFLSDKDESESTKKYISTMAIFQYVYAIALALYFIFF